MSINSKKSYIIFPHLVQAEFTVLFFDWFQPEKPRKHVLQCSDPQLDNKINLFRAQLFKTNDMIGELELRFQTYYKHNTAIFA